MSRSLIMATAALLSLACGEGTADRAPSDAAPPTSPPGDTAAPALDAMSAADLRERALDAGPPGISPHLAVRCTDAAAWCGYETVQPDNETLAQLLDALEHACNDGPVPCTVFLESIDAGEDGQKHARIALHPVGPPAATPAASAVAMAPGALDAPTAARIVDEARTGMPAELRDDLRLRCTPQLGCSLRTEQVDNESIAELLDVLSDACERSDPPACAVWLTDLYQHPDTGRKVADIALTTAD